MIQGTKLTPIEFIEQKTNGKYWKFLCACGNTKIIRSIDVYNGKTKSCGCLRHKKSRSKEYTALVNIKDRCYNTNNKYYNDYGGRGIKVSNEWLNSFETFLNDMGECPKKFTIDRINNELGYSKENCKWVSQKEQIRNRRNTLIVTYNNETKPLAQFCEELGLVYDTILNRIKRLNWKIEDALSTPIRYDGK